jgi:hypothetical protein
MKNQTLGYGHHCFGAAKAHSARIEEEEEEEEEESISVLVS